MSRGPAWITSLRSDPSVPRADAVAGVPGAIASVPDGMASAVLVGVNPVYGLDATRPAQRARRAASLGKGIDASLIEGVSGRQDWPWHCFHLRPLPQLQGSLRPRRASSAA